MTCPWKDTESEEQSEGGRDPSDGQLPAGDEQRCSSSGRDPATAAAFSALVRAAASGDVASVGEVLMRRGREFDVNTPDSMSVARQTPLIAAAVAGLEAVVGVLLRWPDTDVNARGGAVHSAFPLLEAARRGHRNVVSVLLHSAPGLDVNQRAGGEYSSTALLAAAARGHEGVIQELIHAQGLDLNAVGTGGKTALRLAAGAGHAGAVAALLEASGVEVGRANPPRQSYQKQTDKIDLNENSCLRYCRVISYTTRIVFPW
jgi:hypothetical protein